MEDDFDNGGLDLPDDDMTGGEPVDLEGGLEGPSEFDLEGGDEAIPGRMSGGARARSAKPKAAPKAAAPRAPAKAKAAARPAKKKAKGGA
jgi:hypothetical protein